MRLHFANRFAKQQWPIFRPFLFQYPGFPSNVPPVGHAPGTFVYINGAVCDDVTVLLWVLIQYESPDLKEGTL